MLCKLFCATLMALFCLGNPAFADKAHEYSLSVCAREDSTWALSALYFAQIVRERTNGRITIRPRFTGKAENEFQLLRQGELDFAFASSLNWSSQVRELSLFSLPFFLAKQNSPYLALDAIVKGKAGEAIKKALSRKSVQIIGWAEHGFQELITKEAPSKEAFTKKTPLTGLTKLSAKASNAPICLESLHALGIETSAEDIQGKIVPITGELLPQKLWTEYPYLYPWHYAAEVVLIAVNTKVWQNLSQEDQRILLSTAEQTRRYSIALARVGLDDGRSKSYLYGLNKVPEVTNPYAYLEEQGMKIIVPSPEQRQEFYLATAAVRKAWIQKIGPELVKLAEADMATAR